MEDSDFSDITTYSQDITIAKYLQDQKNKREENQKTRQKIYEEASIWYLDPNNTKPGWKFHSFSHEKIKFSFTPGDITDLINKNIQFFCILKYNNLFWRLGKHSLPSNLMPVFTDLFYKENYISDANLETYLDQLYDKFYEWTENEQQDKMKRYKKFTEGVISDMDLFSDEQDIFLEEEDKQELLRKREKILSRMIPPKKKVSMRRNITRRKKIIKPKKIAKRIRKTRKFSLSSEDIVF